MEIIIAMSIAFLLGAWVRRPVLPKLNKFTAETKSEVKETALSESENRQSKTDDDIKRISINKQLDNLLNFEGRDES